ncbi:MAG: hypothetical protein IJ287_04260, partial [Methanobrevibacter sp.]|nr:hypothetical protein [Methanobrevibacter sp.]
YQSIMSFILIVANRIGLTNYEHITIDGTIKKAYNSPFNIIKEKDISLLIRHYMVQELTNGEIKKLRKTARKFLNGRVQNLMFTIVASYNLIRLFGIIKENKMDLFSVISSIRFIALN